jgi:hypothetical protein
MSIFLMEVKTKESSNKFNLQQLLDYIPKESRVD